MGTDWDGATPSAAPVFGLRLDGPATTWPGRSTKGLFTSKAQSAVVWKIIRKAERIFMEFRTADIPRKRKACDPAAELPYNAAMREEINARGKPQLYLRYIKGSALFFKCRDGTQN